MYTLQCHAGSVTAAAFNKDDDYFASGGMDKQVGRREVRRVGISWENNIWNLYL